MQEILDHPWLKDERSGATPQRFFANLLVVRSGDDNNLSSRHGTFDSPAVLKSVEARHVEIKDNDIWHKPCRGIEQLIAIHHASHHLACGTQQSRQRPENFGVVIGQ